MGLYTMIEKLLVRLLSIRGRTCVIVDRISITTTSLGIPHFHAKTL